jgi:hypothetical protein
MLKWNEAASEAADENMRSQKNRQQDEAFCRALREAMWAGNESCAEGVSKEPGTKMPIFKYRPSE